MSIELLHIVGQCSPQTDHQLAYETDHFSKLQSNLCESGFKVVTVGTPADGVSEAMIDAALRKHTNVRMFLVSAHGNISGKDHMIMLHAGQPRLPAAALYKRLADFTPQPLNVFMESCGAGSSAKAARESLPLGSTLVTFSEENALKVHFMDANAYRLPSGCPPTAEGLFINLMLNGLKGTQNRPQLCVVNHLRNENWTWPLWQVISEFDHLDDFYSDEEHQRERREELLRPYLGNGNLQTADATLRLLHRSIFTDPLTGYGTPLEITLLPDMDEVVHDMAQANLLGPVCAFFYAGMRAKIGAFQSWEKTDYLPPQPNRPLSPSQRLVSYDL